MISLKVYIATPRNLTIFITALVLFILLLLGYEPFYQHPEAARAAGITLTQATFTPVGQPGAWQLLFNDEFEATSLDSTKWTTCYWWDYQGEGCTNAGNQELQWYQPDDILVGQGTLKLRAQKRTMTASNGSLYDYTSGMITSGRQSSDKALPPKFAFQYGYAEMRAKVPAGQGMWPAFWLLPVTHESKPEIDVMEILGHEPDTIQMHFHFWNSAGEKDNEGQAWRGPDFSAGWHIFAVDWQPEAIIWYVDGVERWRYTDIAHLSAEPMYLLANLAVGGDYPGPPAESTLFPSFFEIDYIRVWQRERPSYLYPTADTFVDESEPDSNYGSEINLFSDGDPAKTTYLKFDTSAWGKTRLTTATLRLTTLDETGADTKSAHSIQLIPDNTWDEDTLTYLSQSEVSGEVVGRISEAPDNAVVEIPLDISALQSHIGTEFTLVISSSGEDGLYFYSTNNRAHQPLLIASRGPIDYIYLPLILKKTN